jgi:hypothetical protein
MARDQADDPPPDRRQQPRDIEVGRCGRKAQRAVRLLGEHTLRHQGMEVDVGIECRPEPLDSRHRSADAAAHATPGGAPSLETEHSTAEPVIPGERVAQSVRQRQHPLAHRQATQHAVHQVRGQLRHAPGATRWAEACPEPVDPASDAEGTGAAADATTRANCARTPVTAYASLLRTRCLHVRRSRHH